MQCYGLQVGRINGRRKEVEIDVKKRTIPSLVNGRSQNEGMYEKRSEMLAYKLTT
jgi:hypothetical protein